MTIQAYEIGYYYSIDKRDDPIDPTEGWNLGFGQDLAGPSGDVTFIRTSAVANYYYEITEGLGVSRPCLGWFYR